jgi:hypothetical protein
VVLPAAFISVSNLTSVAGGIAAAIAVGAFIGQALTVPRAEQARREAIATGGLIGFLTMIGLILFSAKWG